MEIKVALAGNPNCGKTTLFNALTGSNQYVGNWPGVTVEKKEGRLKGNREVVIQDLPGIYSLSPYTLEEVVSRNYLVNDKPDVILNIIDGTNIERNLYLTTQLVEIGIPMVIAVNMMDVVRKNGDKVDIKKLSQELGCKFVEISALRGEGIDKISELCLEAAKDGKQNSVPSVFEGSVEHAIAHIEEHLEGKADDKNLRWFAVKVFERDSVALEQLKLDEGTKKSIEAHIADCENELDDDAESIITNQRYNYIKKLVDSAVVKKRKVGELSPSDKIDKIVTNRILALPIFAVVMFLVYYVSVTTLGTIVTDWTNDVFVGEWIQPFFENLLTNAGASDWVISLVVNGIIGGLGAPLGFAPQMAIVFFFLTILEDCGYMARVAFIMDRLFRRFGLSGKSFIPFLISSGCGVPGIMATRTIEEEKDRRMTMITTTSIPCGAKLPVIAVIAGYLMGGAWWFAPTIYFAGIAMVIIMCIIMKKTNMFSGDPAPFVMELPAYHIPSAKNVFLHVWERVWAFLKKAGTILFLCCAVMWFLGAFGIVEGAFTLVENVEDSFLASIGNVFAWMFAPIGFGSWQAVAASLSGFVAKEGLVTTLSVVSSLGEELEEYDEAMNVAFRAFFPTSMAAVSFLIFNIFDSPCLAAISAMAKEIGSRKWFWFAIAFQNVNAYLICLMVYQLIGLMVGQVAFSVFTVAAVLVLFGYLYLLFRPDPNARKAVSGVRTAVA